MAELTATELAARLGISRRHAVELVASGTIAGRKLSSGAWLADAASVLHYEAAARRGSGGRISTATAWGLLWELSNLHASWLTPSTRWRVHRRLRTMSAEEIARTVSSRTRTHRYRAANPSKASTELIITGRAVASLLDVGLMDDIRRVCGYLPSGGDVKGYASTHFMVEDTTGLDVLYENTVPSPVKGNVMPIAVIAADLAVSPNTRERSGGLRALEKLCQQWIEANQLQR
ncbi:hypothetical protein RWH45_06535 [Microbacterium sp. KSW4-17]|uniref:Helix-turn-helix domain-containing protein n=1 Tax=Microbacterium galbum TaxID=3075994 RepID=A0ABU3T6B1_9MICO|nr:hypothetical protein [Microbacterium sp. KSW4-17]MDU0366866.1 hypothetical protein [Microbacterium sp. KSW4-17]